MIEAAFASGILVPGYTLGQVYILRQNAHLGFLEIMFMFIWLFQLFLISFIGSRKYDQAASLYLKVNAALTESTGSMFCRGQLLLSAVSEVPLNTSAGSFNVSYTFFMNIIGLMITYLVI